MKWESFMFELNLYELHYICYWQGLGAKSSKDGIYHNVIFIGSHDPTKYWLGWNNIETTQAHNWYMSFQHDIINAVDSLRPSDAYIHQYNIPTLVQIMACRLFGAKPLSEQMLHYGQLDPKEHISVKFPLKFQSFRLKKCTWKWRPFCLLTLYKLHCYKKTSKYIYIFFSWHWYAVLQVV